MHRKRTQLILGAAIILLAAAGVLAFPKLIEALPYRVKAQLPAELIQLAITPPAITALPTPRLQATYAATLQVTILPAATERATAVPSPVPDQNPTRQAAASPAPTRQPTITPRPTAVRLENLQIIPQKFNNCGPANLAINLEHLGHSVEQLEIAAVIRPTYEDRNVSPAEMVDYVNNNTPLRAQAFSGGDLEMLKQLLAAGFPVIIEKGLVPSEWEGWMGHYLTLVGYDDQRQIFFTLDTFLGPWDSSGREESFDFIETHWQQFNYTFLLLYEPENEISVKEIVGEEMFDPLVMWQRRAVKAQQDIEADPENSFAWYNLGTSLTHLGKLEPGETHYEKAAAAFDQARLLGLPWRMLWYQFEIYEAYLANGRSPDVLALAQATLESGGGQFVEETWLFRGLAYQQQGDFARAEADFRRALTLKPGWPEAQEAQASLP